MFQKSLTFNEEKHEYRWNGVVVPSVTQILTGCGLINFDHIPEHLRKPALLKGSIVHKATSLFDNDDLDFSSISERTQKYLDSWFKFRSDSDFPEIVANELALYSVKYGYAMTLDRVILMSKGYTLPDIKTSADSKSGIDLQLAAYSACWNELFPDKRIRHRIGVHLSETGYKISTHKNPGDFNDFRICQQMYNLKKKRKGA